MQIRLRKLEEKDAQGMYEWMTDPGIIRFFRFDASSATLQTCREFILHAYDDPTCIHYAIVNDYDEYLGTISLKNITEKNAEYAISTRKKTHGTGVAYKATMEILRIAFEELHLQQVYLNVLEDNNRAKAFYKKCGFEVFDHIENTVIIKKRYKSLAWYHFTRSHFEFMKSYDIRD